MPSFFDILFFPIKLLVEAEPNSIMRGILLLVCIVWYFFLFSLGLAIWHSLPVVWAFIVMVAKAIWTAYQFVMFWFVPPFAVLHFVVWTATDDKRARAIEAQETKLTSWFKEHLTSRMEKVAEDDHRRGAEAARLRDALAQIEARLAKLEPIPLETVETMNGVMGQFVKGGDA